MFGNFLYFIIVLLIYATYQPPENTNLSLFAASIFFFLFIGLFTVISWVSFYRLSKKVSNDLFFNPSRAYNKILNRLSIFSIALFTVNIYGLNLPVFINRIPLFITFPFLQVLFFLSLFILFLVIVWSFAHETHQKIHQTEESRSEYIKSQIFFNIPIILPYLLLSATLDIINILPFETPQKIMSTDAGQVTFFFLFLIAFALTGPAMIQRFWGCTPVKKGPMRQRIEDLCNKAGIQYADILLWPIFKGKMITAGVMGLIKKFRYILVTHALLSFLTPDEIDAVIAHEIGHVKQKHLLFYLLFFCGYMVLSFATNDMMMMMILVVSPASVFEESFMPDQTTYLSILIGMMTIILFVLYFRYVFGYFIRNFERQADTYVYRLFNSSKPLISTFQKITATSGQSPDTPNWHHFSITERILFLKKCETDKTWIERHNLKIKRSMGIYLIVIILIGFAGYQLKRSNANDIFARNFMEKLLLSKVSKNATDASLFLQLGELYYSGKNYAKAIEAYQKSLVLNPNDPYVLNNLAWLYATCEDPLYFNPIKALRLSKIAVKISESEFILDTLAESYYVNGQFAQAVKTARKALLLAKDKHSYYENQLNKFKEAQLNGIH